MGTNQDEEVEIDLLELFYALKRGFWLILIAGLLAAGVAGMYTAFVMKPVYTSSTMLYVVNKSTALPSLTDLQLGTQLSKDYKVMITSRPVTQKVIENLDLNMDHEALVVKISVDNPSDTRVLTISVRDNDPYMAKTIVDELAQVASARMAEIMGSAPPNIIEEGNLPTRKTSPSISKNTMMGGVLGVFLAMFLIVVEYLLNDSIRTPEDVEKYLGLTVLGTIPVFNEENAPRKKGKKEHQEEQRNPRSRKKKTR